jgi:hypothetical protein
VPGPADTAAEPIDDLRIREILSRWWGFETLRPLQADAIRAALAGRDSLVVMPTGGGKSLCYQLPPLVNETTDVVVSPLVALMKDQVDALEAIGYPAAALHSGLSPDERRQIRDRLASTAQSAVRTIPRRYRLAAPPGMGQAHGMQVIVCGGPSELERSMAEAICTTAQVPVLNQVGKDTLPQLLGLGHEVLLLSINFGKHFSRTVDAVVVGKQGANRFQNHDRH